MGKLFRESIYIDRSHISQFLAHFMAFSIFRTPFTLFDAFQGKMSENRHPKTPPLLWGVCFHTFCSKMLVELEKTELKMPNGYFTGKIWENWSKSVFWPRVFFSQKKWGTNKIEYVCICHGHPWVSGQNSIPTLTNYSAPPLSVGQNFHNLPKFIKVDIKGT